MRIVLTGGIACGKSQFAKFLRELGVLTLDADDIVHELIPAEERRRIADRIFADPAARRALEARIHPQVKSCFSHWFDMVGAEDFSIRRFFDSSICNSGESKNRRIEKSKNRKIKVAIIPLLFECNWDPDYDIILCISSPVETQIRRMVETRGMTRDQALARLSAQLPVSEKVARSHYVIENDSTLEHLREEAVKCVRYLES